MQDLLIVLVFGEDKKAALESLFASGSEEEIPARFYKRREVAEKVLIVTDQAF
jgi:6-phosphogluconolactonase/glucosamine-6-phosphate isomerase/deaminase